MSARNITTNQLVNGYVSNGWYNGRKSTTFRQRCPLVNNTAFFSLNYQLPPRARIVWAEVVTVGTTTNENIVVSGNDATNTANSYALMMHPAAATATTPLTQPQTATVSNPNGGTNGYQILLAPGLTTAPTNMARGIPLLFGTNVTNIPANTHTSVGALITLQPSFTNSNRVYASASSGYIFGSTVASTNTAGTVDVTLYVEEYDQAPYA